MVENIPFYIVPLLVEQPTWGGQYIATYKDIHDPDIAQRKIGQSFELFSDSFVTYTPSARARFAWATATDLANPQFINRPADVQTLQSLIDEAPVQILGKKVLQKYGTTMQVLIKFTQAQNNSYQVHVKPGAEFGKWQAKPESWYFMEAGKATLGIRPNINLADYQRRCLEIEQKAQALSQSVLNKKLSVAEARIQLKNFIDQDHPQNYVNTVYLSRESVVDLSAGGQHHSWEMDEQLPNGNIVYEVQLNVMDEFCTLRAFDQGNIKDDGKVRPLTITDYFQALDTAPAQNDPQKIQSPTKTILDQDAEVTTLFHNQFYSTSKISLTGRYGGLQTETQGSFHHLFVADGRVEVMTDKGHWPVEKGWSLFIPAGVVGYQLNSQEKSVVLKTSV